MPAPDQTERPRMPAGQDRTLLLLTEAAQLATTASEAFAAHNSGRSLDAAEAMRIVELASAARARLSLAELRLLGDLPQAPSDKED